LFKSFKHVADVAAPGASDKVLPNYSEKENEDPEPSIKSGAVTSNGISGSSSERRMLREQRSEYSAIQARIQGVPKKTKISREAEGLQEWHTWKKAIKKSMPEVESSSADDPLSTVLKYISTQEAMRVPKTKRIKSTSKSTKVLPKKKFDAEGTEVFVASQIIRKDEQTGKYLVKWEGYEFETSNYSPDIQVNLILSSHTRT
jgi:hypothetical protein